MFLNREFLLRILVYSVGSLATFIAPEIIVETPLGRVAGLNLDTGVSFFGIPYAEPPKRFQKPEPVKPWIGTKNVFQPGGKICSQRIALWMAEFLPSIDISEDCLLLDIHVPGNLTDGTKRPVVIYFSAENFNFGQRGTLGWNDLVEQGNVIFVIPAFRLGVFGFMSTGDSVIPGNAGLWDQKLSIEWVKDNIKSFGGDPDRITLAGFKSGAISVSLQATTQLNSGKFQSIMVFSHFANSPGAICTNPNKFAQFFASRICPKQVDNKDLFTSKEIYDCLLLKSEKELIDASFSAESAYTMSSLLNYAFAPVIDNDFISDSDDLTHLLPVDIMLFFVENEYFYNVYQSIAPYQSLYKFSTENDIPREIVCNIYVPYISDMYNLNLTAAEMTSFRTLLCNKYTSDNKDEQSNNAVRIVGDFLAYAPAMELVEKHSKLHSDKNTFVCLFAETNPMDQTVTTISWLSGSIGTDPITFLTTIGAMSGQFPDAISPTTVAVSKMTIQYGSSFIERGNPNDDNTVFPWTAYTPNVKSYLRLQENPLTESNLYEKRVNFWLKDVPNYLNPTTTSQTISTTTPKPTTTANKLTTKIAAVSTTKTQKLLPVSTTDDSVSSSTVPTVLQYLVMTAVSITYIVQI